MQIYQTFISGARALARQRSTIAKEIWYPIKPRNFGSDVIVTCPSVRLSTPQGHQYEVAYTGYNPVLNPVFLARNRMLTRIVAKQAKTTKDKNKFFNGKKKLKRILSSLFGGRRKVQFR